MVVVSYQVEKSFQDSPVADSGKNTGLNVNSG